MDPYWYALACIVIGGTLGVVVPYLFKVMDSEVTFSFSYFYAMSVSMAIAAVALVPEPIGELTGRMIMMLVLSGFGIQAAANLVTSKVRKGISERNV
jgi:ABC-type dipeptide/oligopeptide/nickel transport system permease subunit